LQGPGVSLGDVLNTDLEVVGARLREGLAWWLDELAAMAAPLKSRTRRGGALTAERRADGVYILRRPDHPDRMHSPGAARVSAALALPADIVLRRRLQAPPMPERDVRRMMTLDLDRLTPFAPGAVYLDIIVAPAAEPGGRRHALLAVAPRPQADLAVTEAQAAGIDPVAVIAPNPDGEPFDFLPAMRAAGAMGGRSGTTTWLWAAVAVLLALNIGLAIWRDARSLAKLDAMLAVQQPVVDRIHQLQKAAHENSAQMRREARAAGEPLRVLKALSEGLPQDAWVQRMSWDGASVRIVGLRHEGVDVVAALRREPLFSNVRETDPSSTSEGAFDVVADVSPPVRPGAGR
jgi:general secretion pathway protein L